MTYSELVLRIVERLRNIYKRYTKLNSIIFERERQGTKYCYLYASFVKQSGTIWTIILRLNR